MLSREDRLSAPELRSLAVAVAELDCLDVRARRRVIRELNKRYAEKARPGQRGPQIDAVVLRDLRLSKGLSQLALGRLAGVDASHVCRIESGVRTHPSPRITQALAEALGVEVRDLLAAHGGGGRG